jgi:uncharacterized protein YkwD
MDVQQKWRRVTARIGAITVAWAVTLAVSTAATTAHAGLARAAAACDGAETPIAATTVAQSASVLACLIDTVREERGRAALGPDERLREAARDHAADMVGRGYFGHVTPAGRDQTDRLRRVGWPPAASGWWAGEILALGSGGASTPRHLVSAWLNSPPHRGILLSRKPTLIGLGVVRNTPDGAHPGDGVTIAAELGHVDGTGGDAGDPLSSYSSEAAAR